MDGKFYVKILENHLGEINKMLGKKWRLQQDNDPKHTSRIAKEFLLTMCLRLWIGLLVVLTLIPYKIYGPLLRATLRNECPKI